MPPATDRLRGPRKKLERAERHLNELGMLVRAVCEPRDDMIVVQDDAHGSDFTVRDAEGNVTETGTFSERSYALASVPSIPPDVPTVFGEVLFSCRSALDHVAFGLCPTHGLPNGTLQNIYFPVFDGPQQYNTTATEVRRLAKPSAIKVLDGIKPYKGGKGHDLWTLNKLNRIDKHRMLLTTMVSITGADMRNAMREMIGGLNSGAAFEIPDSALVLQRPVPKVLKAGDPYAVISNAKPNQHVQPVLDIALAETGVVDLESILVVGQRLIDVSRSTVEAFDDASLFP